MNSISRRIPKVNKLIKQEVGKLILSDISFPKDVFVTITGVKASADLRYADIFISIFPTGNDEETMKALNENVYLIQQKINKKLSMRPVPKIRFKIDRAGEYVERIDGLIKKASDKS